MVRTDDPAISSPGRGNQSGKPRKSSSEARPAVRKYWVMALLKVALSKCSRPDRATSQITSKVAVSISVTSSAFPPQAASLAQTRAAVAVMAGARARTLRWVNTGATAWRCHFHSAPSALNRLSPMAGRNMRRMISDLG
jgi:hypothetical protein